MYVQGQGEESFKKWRMEKIIGSEVRWFDIYFPLLKGEKDILEKGIPREKDVATFFIKLHFFMWQNRSCDTQAVAFLAK